LYSFPQIILRFDRVYLLEIRFLPIDIGRHPEARGLEFLLVDLLPEFIIFQNISVELRVLQFQLTR
jgi:hypothetical protein